jgi:hypothetical protein
MATPEQWALGKLDGRNPDSGETEPWRPVELYRRVTDSQQGPTARDNAGAPWKTPSVLDETTVLAEVLTVVYRDEDGQEWTLADMIIELFKAHRANEA